MAKSNKHTSFLKYFISKYLKPVDDTIDYDPEQLAKGTEEEMEHTKYPKIAEVIAKQQIAANPSMYKNKEDIS